ncbi:MAG: hypothetical protein ACLP1E_09905 [Acidimicrobiales bacterium]
MPTSRWFAVRSADRSAREADAVAADDTLAHDNPELFVGSVGGADPGHGSGLIGLRDRVESLGGTMDVESVAGAGALLVSPFPSPQAGRNAVIPASAEALM